MNTDMNNDNAVTKLFKFKGHYSFLNLSLRRLALLSVTITSPAAAELYFFPAFIADDATKIAELTRFSSAGKQLPGAYRVDVYINGELAGNHSLRFDEAKSNGPVPVTVSDDTGLKPCLTDGQLTAMGINVRSSSQTTGFTDQKCILPEVLIPGAVTRFNFQLMRLDISIPHAAVVNPARGYIAPERWDDGITAALLNYSIHGVSQRAGDKKSSTQYLDLYGGFNTGPWRFRQKAHMQAFQNHTGSHQKWRRAETSAERGINPLHSRLLIGQGTTGGEIFEPLAFTGVRSATDESMLPDGIRGYAPIIRGTARTNALVSIRQKENILYQTFVSPGPFEITDLYAIPISSDLDVLVQEADGRIQRSSLPFSSVPVLVREGYTRYSVAAGRYRPENARYSAPAFFQGTLVRGLPYNMTAYGGTQLTRNYQSAMLGIGVSLGSPGALSFDVTEASSRLPNNTRATGGSAKFQYQYTDNTFSTTFRLGAKQHSSGGFYSLDDTARKNAPGHHPANRELNINLKSGFISHPDYDEPHNRKRANIHFSLSQPLGQSGTIYLSGSRQTYWSSRVKSDLLHAGFNSSKGSVSYGASYHHTRVSNKPAAEHSLFISLSVPLELPALRAGKGKRGFTHAAFSVAQTGDGKISPQTTLSGTAIGEKKLSWSLSGAQDPGGRGSGNMSVSYEGIYGSRSLGYSYGNDYRQMNFGIDGGVIVHQDGLTFGQPVGETGVLISVPELTGVGIENEGAVKTDRRGYAIKPYASGYRENRVALNLDSLSGHDDIEESVVHVIPTKGAIVKAEFKGHRGYRILMTLTHESGPLPFGSLVTGHEREGITGDGGEVYLSGMPVTGTVKVVWGDDAAQQCLINYTLPSSEVNKRVARVTARCD